MVTLVSIKLRGESNIIDDNPTMKQADEMSLQFIRDPNIISTFFFSQFFQCSDIWSAPGPDSWFIRSALH